MAAGAPGKNIAVCKQLTGKEGPLSRLIHSPLYNLFPHSAIFESSFTQVTKKGMLVTITNIPTTVTIGITSSEPSLPVPNILLMAKRKWASLRGYDGTIKKPRLQVTRMLPIQDVRIAVHNSRQKIIRFHMVTGKVYYLQLHEQYAEIIFTFWCRLIEILKQGPRMMKHSMVHNEKLTRSLSFKRNRLKQTGKDVMDKKTNIVVNFTCLSVGNLKIGEIQWDNILTPCTVK